MSDIIKFNCIHETTSFTYYVGDIEPYRQILVQKGLLGRDPNRYGGYSYGNISIFEIREFPDSDFVMISGTQTSHIPVLDSNGYALITSWDLDVGRVVSVGAVKPSSESLTHLAVYEQGTQVNCVVHVHSPKIWNNPDIPRTNASAEYGSLEMVKEVDRLFLYTNVAEQQIFAMGGHEDGVIAFGSNLDLVVDALVSYL